MALLLAHSGNERKSEPFLAKISQEMLAAMIGTTRSRKNFFMNKFRTWVVSTPTAASSCCRCFAELFIQDASDPSQHHDDELHVGLEPPVNFDTKGVDRGAQIAYSDQQVIYGYMVSIGSTVINGGTEEERDAGVREASMKTLRGIVKRVVRREGRVGHIRPTTKTANPIIGCITLRPLYARKNVGTLAQDQLHNKEEREVDHDEWTQWNSGSSRTFVFDRMFHRGHSRRAACSSIGCQNPTQACEFCRRCAGTGRRDDGGCDGCDAECGGTRPSSGECVSR